MTKSEPKLLASVKYYLYSDKDGNSNIISDLLDEGTIQESDLDKDCEYNFRYTCYEVEFQMDIYSDGSSYLTHIQKQKIPEPVKVS